MLTGEGFRLDGKVALVSGSGRNIGRAVAEAFAAAGAKVGINGHRDRAALDEVAAGVRDRGGELRGAPRSSAESPRKTLRASHTRRAVA